MLKRWFAPTPGSSSPLAHEVTGEGVVRLTTQNLLALRHSAGALHLSPSRIRSARSGGYLSPFKGRGMEFDEVRPYQQGDDVRSLDWRVTARTGRPHTKLFREERERTVLLSIDLRHGMFFATRGAFKAVRAAQAAALLGWSASDGGDRLGGLLFGDSEHRELRPGKGKPSLLQLLRLLGEAPLWRDGPQARGGDSATSLLASLQRLRRVTPPGSLLFIASDFAGLGEEAISQLHQIARHNEVVLLFCHDPLESQLPPAGHYRVSNGRQRTTINSASKALREHYRNHFMQHLARLERLARRPGIHLLELPSSEHPLACLQRRFGVSR